MKTNCVKFVYFPKEEESNEILILFNDFHLISSDLKGTKRAVDT